MHDLCVQDSNLFNWIQEESFIFCYFSRAKEFLINVGIGCCRFFHQPNSECQINLNVTYFFFYFFVSVGISVVRVAQCCKVSLQHLSIFQ
jgi:hypothetical protein